LSTTRNSSTQIVATILVNCAGDYSIAVANPQPGGGLSAPATISVPSIAASVLVAQPNIVTNGGTATNGGAAANAANDDESSDTSTDGSTDKPSKDAQKKTEPVPGIKID
jgi:hypothetical protein